MYVYQCSCIKTLYLEYRSWQDSSGVEEQWSDVGGQGLVSPEGDAMNSFCCATKRIFESVRSSSDHL